MRHLCVYGAFEAHVVTVNGDEASEWVAVDIICRAGRTPVTPEMIRTTLIELKAHPPDCECQGCIAAAKAKPQNVAFWCRRWQR